MAKTNHSPASESALRRLAHDWYHGRNWEPFPFQEEVMTGMLAGKSGLLNAPTGSGKTYALWIPTLLNWIRQHPEAYADALKAGREAYLKAHPQGFGLQVLWITPLRALSKDIRLAAEEACIEMQIPWKVEIRTGDTSTSQRARQKRRMPEGLITTPESMHVLFSNKAHLKLFQHLQVVVIDEWHELLGSKRGIQVELALAHLRQVNPTLQVWGISATIGNLDEALDVLVGPNFPAEQHVQVRAHIDKKIEVESVLPKLIEKFPWSGHLGVNMVEEVLPILHQSESSLVFTNTRAQCELWYRTLLEADPDLAGVIAMHHGSISSEMRAWVEEALHAGQLKVVVCTASLDLGVDFRPVETIFQVGGPKGVARFVQRAGRSGHRPGAVSKIYFVPTHSLELVEAAALRQAVKTKLVEDRQPIFQPMDVLVQYLMTLAVADGFYPQEAYEELLTTHAYAALTEADYNWALDFLTTGGKSLYAYEEYQKIEVEEDGRFKVNNKRIALQHRLSIGTIVGDVNMTVKYLSGKKLGTVEESFISQVNPQDTFWFAGRNLELVRIRNNEVLVKASKAKKGKVPRWMGSRMPLSSPMAYILRQQLDDFRQGDISAIEMKKLAPLLELQERWSAIPGVDDCLVEVMESREGHHLFIYSFEGRVVHQIMGSLVAWRIAQMRPMSFSIGMNDYGFELLSDQEIPIEEALEQGIFSPDNLTKDLPRALNETEMAQRRFREVASIAGLVFQGFPGKQMKSRHLQASTSLLFKVFEEHDPDNLLLKQAYREVVDHQIDGDRLHHAMQLLNGRNVILTRPPRFTPFCFPIMVDRLRERLSSERLIDRVMKMQVQLEKAAG